MNSFTFNGVNSKAMGVVCSGSGSFNAPERDVTVVEIPGRNGNLILDNKRFRNASISYPAFMPHDFPANVAALRSWLLAPAGYCRLTDDYNPGEFRLARYVGGVTFDEMAFLNRAAGFTVNFDAKPQRFLTSGETPVTISASGGTITNPTAFDALPLLRVSGSGAGQINVNGTAMSLNILNGYIDIDCDAQMCYKDAQSMAAYVDGNFPTLAAGENTITWSGGVSSVIITPRWWRI